MKDTWLKVGQVASRTGLTVRTLHHWEEIGLLYPGERTEAGHRLYGAAQIARLQHIVTLRTLGFTLDAIKGLLTKPEWDLEHAIRAQLEVLDEELARARRTKARLERVQLMLQNQEPADVTLFLDAIKETIDMEKHYTEAQLAELAKRREELGEEGMRAAEQAWAELFESLRAHMEAGTDAADPALDELAARYRALISSFTGDDPGIAESLDAVYEEEGPEKASGGLMDPALFSYAGAMMAARAEEK